MVAAIGREEAWLSERLQHFQNPRGVLELEQADGSWLAIREEHTEDGGMLFIVSDITERKQTEMALRDSEQRFRDFAETAADWFWEMDENLHISYLSERYFELTGESAQSVLSLSYAELCSSHTDHPDGNQAFKIALQARQPFNNVEWVYTGYGNGKTLFFMLGGKPFYDHNGHFKGFRGTGRNITDSKRLEEKLNHQASHDSLTGLINRHAFEQQLDLALQQACFVGSHHVLCYIDLDQFKIVNDTVGHHAGDQLLQQVAVLISRTIRNHDTAARLGGDEFGVLLSECMLEEARYIADRLISELSEFRFVWDNHLFEIGASIGMVEVSSDTKDINELMAQADVACYAAKDQGRNRAIVYHADDAELFRLHTELLRAAGI
jgi:diguanylate cyclase (GGDEF)-like protein/PAS domain S-box-containing protein